MHLLEGVARVDELVHAEEGGAAARVPLRPLGLQPYALVGVAEGAVVLLEGHVRRRAVRVEDVVLGVELDRLLEQVDGAAVVLLVERLDRALLRLERLALPRHLLGDRVHDGLELLLEGVVPRVELEPLLEHALRPLELALPEVDATAAEVPLRPRRLQPHALVGVLHRPLVVLERDVRGAAVRVEHVRLLVEGERHRQVLHRALVVLRLEVVDRHLLERVDRRLDHALGEEQHLLGVVDP